MHMHVLCVRMHVLCVRSCINESEWYGYLKNLLERGRASLRIFCWGGVVQVYWNQMSYVNAQIYRHYRSACIFGFNRKNLSLMGGLSRKHQNLWRSSLQLLCRVTVTRPTHFNFYLNRGPVDLHLTTTMY